MIILFVPKIIAILKLIIALLGQMDFFSFSHPDWDNSAHSGGWFISFGMEVMFSPLLVSLLLLSFLIRIRQNLFA